MFKLKEIREWAEDLKPVLFDINLALNNLHILLKDKRFNKFRINYFDTYLNIMYQQHFILIIQLAKIFSTNNDTHKRNVTRLFNRFQNEGLQKNIFSLSTDDTFKSIEELLAAIKVLKEKIEKNKGSIDNILYLRDKVIAHADPKNTDKTIDLEEYTTLVKLSNEIYNTLFGKIMRDYFYPNITHKYDLISMIDLFG